MVYSKGITRELQKAPDYPAFHWVVIETELRAWVENPAWKYFHDEPVFLLCEIHDVRDGMIAVRAIDDACSVWVDRSLVHCVHTFAPSHNKIVKVHGEPDGLV